jgi:MFS family permease
MEMSTGRRPDTAEPVTCIIVNGERCVPGPGAGPGPRSPLRRSGLGLSGAEALAEEHGFQRSPGPLMLSGASGASSMLSSRCPELSRLGRADAWVAGLYRPAGPLAGPVMAGVCAACLYWSYSVLVFRVGGGVGSRCCALGET